MAAGGAGGAGVSGGDGGGREVGEGGDGVIGGGEAAEGSEVALGVLQCISLMEGRGSSLSPWPPIGSDPVEESRSRQLTLIDTY